jgi:hypothetical protein
MKSENIVMLIAIALAPCADYMPQQGRGQKRTFWRNRLAPPPGKPQLSERRAAVLVARSRRGAGEGVFDDARTREEA